MDFGNPTKGWSGAVIRREFFKHFGELDRWYSSPLILVEDIKAPLLQTTMNRFKQLFMADLPSGEGSTFSFKCIRIGDTLEDFSDTRYHSLTELLGTWHWGEHRREVISKLLGFLKKECGIKMEDIYATYFAGDENLDADTECRDIMLEFLPKGHVSSSTVKGSFWNVDGSGPCGPCLGIYCDNSTRGYEDRDAWTRISLNHRTIPQIWSLVFVQFDREENGALRDLPVKHIITAMDFEHVTTICQGDMSFYQTDVFAPILGLILQHAGTGIEAYNFYVDSEADTYAEDTDQIGMAYRVVANHLRLISVATTCGTQIGDHGREYLLKLIDRRAIELSVEKLGIHQSSYAKLVRGCIEEMADLIPEIFPTKGKLKQERLKRIVKDEVDIHKSIWDEIACQHAQLKPPVTTKKTKSQAEDDLKPSHPTTWYKIRGIKFLDHNTHVVHKDRNEKCTLVALCNALLLGGKISLGANMTQISEGHLLHLVQHNLLCGNAKFELQSRLEYSDIQKKVLDVLPQLSGILSINVELDSINGFMNSAQHALFEHLGVSLYHGCLVDTKDKILTDGGPQLTPQGLTQLQKELKEKEPCVLFWNGSFITATKVEGAIYLLLDDMRFVDKNTHIFWEILKEVYQGGSFTDCNFSLVELDPSFTTLPVTRSERNRWKKMAKLGRKSRAADNGEALEVLQNIHQSDISAPSTSTTCQNGLPLLNTPERRFHKTRQINFRGRQINIIHQEFNGPCGLLGICNVLLLRGAISLEPSLTKVPEDHLISLLQMYLEQNKGGLPYSELPRKALEVLPVLPFGLDVDVSFNRTDCFEETPEIILLRYLGVPIYHGWLPDPADVRLAALSSYTYSSLSIATSDDTFQNVDQARELLTGTQFTSYGLRCLYNDLKENVACVLFRHNHCSTLIKVKEQLYLLVTDSNYIGTPVVWETLTLEGSGVLVDGDFIPVVESPITPLDQPGTLSVYPPFAPPDQLVPQISSERVLPTTAQWPATNLTSNKGDDTDYVGSLEDYIKIPGNHFAEKKNLSALGTSLEVADTRKIGRIIAKALVLQLKDGQAMVSWNGKFDRKSILVRSGFHTMLTAWINAAYGEFSDAAIRNDYTTYVNEVLSLFEVEGVGYPAFFHPLIKTLKEESGLDARSHIQFSNFCHKVEGNLAFKFSLARADYWGGINKIRKHAPGRSGGN